MVMPWRWITYFGKSKSKGKKGDKKGGKNKGGKKEKKPASGEGASQWCGFKGVDPETGEMRCWSPRDNKKRGRIHSKEDLETARQKQGCVPVFNAFDSNNGHTFEQMTR